jgi:hypothetical protein
LSVAISRRSVVIGLSGGTLAIGATDAAELPRATPQENFGPYFPVRMPPYHDFDLTRIPGRPGRALGQVIEVSGRVLRTDGAPVKGAAMEIWPPRSRIGDVQVRSIARSRHVEIREGRRIASRVGGACCRCFANYRPQSRCISLCITGSPSSKRHRDSAAYIELLHF